MGVDERDDAAVGRREERRAERGIGLEPLLVAVIEASLGELEQVDRVPRYAGAGRARGEDREADPAADAHSLRKPGSRLVVLVPILPVTPDAIVARG